MIVYKNIKINPIITGELHAITLPKKLVFVLLRCLTLKIHMNVTDKDIIQQHLKILNKVLFMKRKALFEFNGTQFFPSEVHVMLVLDEKVSTNATKIAELLGVSKSALSQTLSRLKSKGAIIKEKDPYYKNELTLAFTAHGIKAIQYFRRKISKADKRQQDFLARKTREEKLAIYEYLCQYEGDLDGIL